MNSVMPSLQKPQSSSIHSTTNIAFKKCKERQHERFVSSFTKLSNLFSRTSEELQQQKNLQKFHNKNKNMTCINLGMDDEQLLKQLHPQKQIIPKQNQFRQIRTERNTKIIHRPDKWDRIKGYKRIRHQSLVNVVPRYTLFSPNRQKENLQKFQKKLLNTLQKKRVFEKDPQLSFTSSLKMFSCLSNESKQHIPKDIKYLKVRNKQTIVSSGQIISKWKFLARKINNSRQLQPYENPLSSLNKTQFNGLNRKKLIRGPLKQDTTVESIFSSFNCGQNLSKAKSNFMEKSQKSTLNQNYKKSLVLKEKVKFKKIQIISSDSDRNVQDLANNKVQSSQNKLKKLLKCRKSCPIIEKQQVFTPWEYTPSESQIGVES